MSTSREHVIRHGSSTSRVFLTESLQTSNLLHYMKDDFGTLLTMADREIQRGEVPRGILTKTPWILLAPPKEATIT